MAREGCTQIALPAGLYHFEGVPAYLAAQTIDVHSANVPAIEGLIAKSTGTILKRADAEQKAADVDELREQVNAIGQSVQRSNQATGAAISSIGDSLLKLTEAVSKLAPAAAPTPAVPAADTTDKPAADAGGGKRGNR